MSATDINKSFAFLHNNIPQWFINLSAIEAQVASIQNEISKIPVSKSPPMLKRKTGSMESLRDSPMSAIQEEPTTLEPTPQTSVQLSRKRKTPSVHSGHASGPTKYRSRTMVVVQYDGNVQKAFEGMVRDIGTGRNLLRKAKMAAKMQALADLASDSSSDDDVDPMMAKIGYRHRGIRSARTRASLGIPQSGAATPPELFDRSDKFLEQAQSLCETAAHRSLRDGDCRKELFGVRKHFESVLEIATKEVARQESIKQPEDGTNAHSVQSSMEIEPQPKTYLSLPTPTATIRTSKIMEIEVDDEDDDEDYVMPPIRMTSRV